MRFGEVYSVTNEPNFEACGAGTYFTRAEQTRSSVLLTPAEALLASPTVNAGAICCLRVGTIEKEALPGP